MFYLKLGTHIFHPSDDLITIADRNGERTKSLLTAFAKEHKVNIVGGFVAVAKDDSVFNTSYAYNREGSLVGEYSKMHGFSPAKEDKYFASGTHTTHFRARWDSLVALLSVTTSAFP